MHTGLNFNLNSTKDDKTYLDIKYLINNSAKSNNINININMIYDIAINNNNYDDLIKQEFKDCVLKNDYSNPIC